MSIVSRLHCLGENDKKMDVHVQYRLFCCSQLSGRGLCHLFGGGGGENDGMYIEWDEKRE